MSDRELLLKMAKDRAQMMHEDDRDLVLALIIQIESDNKDAERYQWLCDGNGYYLEEAGLCGHSNEKAEADEAIDFYIANGCPP